jgi:death-on-curing protein
VVDEAHFQQVRAHGGSHGIRDERALEAALARPRHRWSYSPGVRLSELAVAYAFGLLMDHPYVDGNKRIALVTLVAFLDLNGVGLSAGNAEAFEVVLAVAAGEMTLSELTSWIEAHSHIS